MTDYVNPSNSFRPLSEEMGRLFRYTGHAHSYIADNATLVSDIDSVGVNAGPLNAFVKVSETGLDFEVDTGEAMIQGALVARDTRTTVSLPANDDGTIYLAWNPDVEHEIVIDYGTSGNVDLPRTALYDYETDGSSITSDTDVRELGEFISTVNSRYETPTGDGIAVDEAIEASTAGNAANLGGNSPSAFAQLAQDETVGGAWTYQNVVNIHAGLRLHNESVHLQMFETDTDSQWNHEVSSGNFNAYDADNDGHIQALSGGDFHAPNGTLHSERGTAAVSGSERYIWVSDGSPSDSQGEDGDIWIEH